MKKSYIVIAVLVLLVIVGVVGWKLGSNSNSKASTPPATSAANPTPTAASDNTTSKSAVKDIASYTLPDGWKEAACDAKPEAVYALPSGVNINCNANPSAPVSITIDPNGTSDCSQLSNNQNVRKHVCKSEDINGKKSLQASTEYLDSSSVSPGMTVSDYYVPVNGKVVKVEYTYRGDAMYQMAFDDLAKSVTTK